VNSLNIRNYNVDTRTVERPVTKYRPKTTYVERRQQYSTLPSDEVKVEENRPKFKLENIYRESTAKEEIELESEQDFESAAEGSEPEEADLNRTVLKSPRVRKKPDRLGINATATKDEFKKREFKSKEGQNRPDTKKEAFKKDNRADRDQSRGRVSRDSSADKQGRQSRYTDRNNSRDRQQNRRDYSRGRDQRDKYNNRYNRSVSGDRSQRNYSSDRRKENDRRNSYNRDSRNYSRERRFTNRQQSKSPGRNYNQRDSSRGRDSRRDRYNKDNKDRNSRQRSISANYNYPRQTRYTGDRTPSRGRYQNRTQSRDRFQNRDRYRSNDRNDQRRNFRYQSQSRSNSRGRSSSGPYYWQPEKCDPGVNCAPDYKKDSAKTCTKCNIHTHREYECKRYNIWNRYKCRVCKLANHIESECKMAPQSRSPGRFTSNLN